MQRLATLIRDCQPDDPRIDRLKRASNACSRNELMEAINLFDLNADDAEETLLAICLEYVLRNMMSADADAMRALTYEMCTVFDCRAQFALGELLRSVSKIISTYSE